MAFKEVNLRTHYREVGGRKYIELIDLILLFSDLKNLQEKGLTVSYEEMYNYFSRMRNA